MKKTCTKCKIEQDISQFHWKNKAKNRRSPHCKECQSIYAHNHYLNNIAIYKNKAKLRNVGARGRSKKVIINYLSQRSCIDCGEENIIVLQFDHVDGKKENEVTRLIWEGASKKRIQKEIERCEIRCANCHILRHAKENQSSRYKFQQARMV